MRGAKRLTYADAHMGNLLLKQQLIVLRRARRRAPNLTRSDRLLCQLQGLQPAKRDENRSGLDNTAG